jgi:hypothetical protein
MSASRLPSGKYAHKSGCGPFLDMAIPQPSPEFWSDWYTWNGDSYTIILNAQVIHKSRNSFFHFLIACYDRERCVLLVIRSFPHGIDTVNVIDTVRMNESEFMVGYWTCGHSPSQRIC